MANLTALLGTTSVTVLAISENNAMDGRSVTTLTLYDVAGTQDFPERTPVTVNDTLNNYFFSGYVVNDQKTPMPNGVALTHQVACVDETDIPVRHYWSGPEWTNRYAGDIVTDLVAGPLSADGITASYALDEDKALSDWQQGTQSNTAAVATATGGALQLARAGTPVTKTQSSTTDWNAGTFSNTAGGNNNLHLAATSTIKLVSTCNGSAGSRLFQMIWTGSYTIVSGDTLVYSMWIADSSPAMQAYIHLHCSNGNNTGGSTADFFGLPEENTDLSGYAKNQWYGRTVDLSAFVGSTVTNAFACFDASNQGTYTAYFHSVTIMNGATLKATIFSSTLNSNIATQDFGYSQTTCSVVSARDPIAGTWTSPSTSLSPVGILQSGLITWQATTPTGTSMTVSTSLDGGITWIAQADNAQIAGVIAGASSSGLTLLTQVAMSITGNDPTLTPAMTVLQCTLTPSYAATKSDVSYTKHTTSDFSAGTLSNTTSQASNAGVTLTGFWRSWSNGLFPNQTLYGAASPNQYSYHRALVLTSSTGSDVRSRLDFAGNTWNILDMSISHDIPTSSNNANNALVYATTNWGNANDSYAYIVYVSATQVQFAKGANSSGAGPFSPTSLGTFVFPVALTANSWHTLRVQWNGTASTQNGIPAHTHNIYVDGVLYLSVVDATYTAAGYVAARHYNNTGGAMQGHFSNFSIVQSYANTTWLSPNYSLNSVGTCGNSLLTWNAAVPSSSTLIAETTIDGGSTWQSATNGGAISGLSNGVNLAGKNLQVRFTFTEDIGQETFLYGFTAWVSSQYSSSGNRISVPLSLAPVGKAGATGITWTGLQLPNTAIYVDTSTDSINWTQAGIGVIGQAAVAGLFSQTDPVVDQFTSNTSANYTSTYRTGGAIAAWVWDTANNRLTVSGGTNAELIYNSPVTGVDVDISAVLDQSDNGGFVWRWVDQGNHYSLVIHDASSGNSPNTAQLFVVNGGTATQIGANAAINFVRGTPHAFRVSMIGTSIMILMDGATLFNTGDAMINQAGFAGFRTDSTGGSSARFYLFRLQYYGQDVSNATIFSRVRFTSTDPTVTPQVNLLSMSVHDPAIQNGALIPQTNYSVLNGNRITIAQICDDLIKQCGFTASATNFWWKVISNKMTFQQHQATPAPWVLTPQGATNCDIVDSPAPMIDNVNPTYRNSQWGTGGTDVVAQSRSFIGNGTQTTFNVGFPIDSIGSITLNNATQTFGLSNVSTGLNWYYTQGQSTVVQDTSGTPINSAQTLTVAFNAQVSITANVQNPTEIARIAAVDQTTGIIDEGEDMSGLNKQAMIAKCSGLVNQFGQQNKTISFTTNRSGLAVGQLLPVFASPLGVFAGAFLLIQVKISWRVVGIGGGAIVQSPRFECQGVAGPQVLGWLRYLSRLGVN